MSKLKKTLSIQELSRQSAILCTSAISYNPKLGGPFTMYPEIVAKETDSSKDYSNGNLKQSFKFLLIVGRLIGVLPLCGVIGGKDVCIRFRWLSFASITNMLTIVLLGINVLVGLGSFFSSSNVHIKELANNFKMPAFYGNGFIIYLYSLLNARKLVNAFKAWNGSKFHFQLTDMNLKRDVIIITCTFLTSIILENLLRTVAQFLTFGQNEWAHDVSNHSEKSISGLESVYLSTPEWGYLFEFHPATAILLIVSNKFALYAWNFSEIFIIACSRAIYYKYKQLGQLGESLAKCKKGSSEIVFGEHRLKHHADEGKLWISLILDHSRLWHIVNKFDEYLSPLILLAFFMDIFFVCTRIAQEIGSSGAHTLLERICVTWSFLQILVRFYFVYKSAANINIYANEVHKVLRKCPANLYSQEIEKYETQLYYNGNTEGCGGSGIGLTGMGFFLITKPTMLHVLSVIFTVELVFLQTSCN